MADYPYEVPPGYTEGMSGGSYNPETGERTSFALPPAPIRVPPDMSGMAGIDWNAVQQNIQNHGVEKALAATSAAIQFQGQRGYQQALKNGEPAEKAMAKYGPMMFYRAPQAFGPAQRALTPPQMTPYQQARLAVERNAPIHVGQGLYRLNAEGKPETIIEPPSRPEEKGRFAIEEPLPGYPASTVRIPPRAFAEQMATLPPYARTNAANVAQLRAAGFDTNGARINQVPEKTAATPQANPASSKRVRVKGPGNAKGTVLEGTKLPEGWSFE